MCLNVVFEKHGCQKYLDLPPRSDCKAGSASCRQKTTLKEEYSNKIKAVTTSIKPFLTFGQWSPGGGSAGCLWHLVSFPELFYVLLSSKRKNILKRHNWGGAILHKVYVFRSAAPESDLIEHTWGNTDHFKIYLRDIPFHIVVWLARERQLIVISQILIKHIVFLPQTKVKMQGTIICDWNCFPNRRILQELTDLFSFLKLVHTMLPMLTLGTWTKMSLP